MLSWERIRNILGYINFKKEVCMVKKILDMADCLSELVAPKMSISLAEYDIGIIACPDAPTEKPTTEPDTTPDVPEKIEPTTPIEPATVPGPGKNPCPLPDQSECPMP